MTDVEKSVPKDNEILVICTLKQYQQMMLKF